jgi:hypothetical protein
MEPKGEGVCTIGLISKNAWGIIAHKLKVQDLIELRRTCQRLNDVVTGMNPRWFRAHQWFVGKNVSKGKVKSAVKTHAGRRLRHHCIPDNHKLAGVHGWNARFHRKIEGIQDGTFTEADCVRRTCWQYKVPQREQDIPLDKNYKPKRNVYMYWYLIECYRYYKREENQNIDYFNNSIIREQRARVGMQNEIVGLQKAIEVSKVREIGLREKHEVALAKYKRNDVFEGMRINSYKGYKAQQAKQAKQAKKKEASTKE